MIGGVEGEMDGRLEEKVKEFMKDVGSVIEEYDEMFS